MRKRLQLLFILLAGISYKAQDNTLAASVNSPAAYQTGVPDISFPLVSLPATKDMNISFGLAYNARSYQKGGYSGNIARNWMLTGGNFKITRDLVNGWPEEIEAKEYWDDKYYYNLNGEQGSFKFEKSGIYPNDTYKIIKLTPSNLIINCVRINVTNGFTPRIIQSFTVTDSKGYKYYFTEYDESKFTYSNGGTTSPTMKLRNTFYIKKIEDAQSRTVVTFDNANYSNDNNDTWCYVPEKVTTAYGSINFEHGDSNEASYTYDFPVQDRYFISGITLNDHKGAFISKSKLKITSSHNFEPNIDGGRDIWYRTLTEISRVDKNNNLADKISFIYKMYPISVYGTSYQPAIDSDTGILSEINYSSGKKVEYNFTFTKIKSPYDFNDPVFINSIKDPATFIYGICFYNELPPDIPIDTKYNRKYILTSSRFLHSPSTRIQVGFSTTEWYPNEPVTNPTFSPGGSEPERPKVFRYRLVDPYPVTGYATPYQESGSAVFIINPSHNVYLEVDGSGGKGLFSLVEKDYLPPPYNNTISGSLVLESIKFYDIAEGTHPSNIFNTYDLKKTINYDYSLFDGSGLSSGVLSEDQEDAVIYKNLKITEMTSRDIRSIISRHQTIIQNLFLIMLKYKPISI